MAGLSLSLLGPLTVRVNGQPLEGLRIRPAVALCVYLACRPGGHRREHLAELLWPGYPSESAHQNLRQTLYTLRRALPGLASREDGDTVPLVLSDRETVQLNPAAAVEVDALLFASLLESLHPTPAQLAEATILYRGDFLADFYLAGSQPFEEWAAAQRAVFRRLILDALDRLAAWAIDQSAFNEAKAYALRQLEIDNLRESAHRQLMLALAWSGQRGDALAQYETCRRLLRAELNVEPEAQTRILAERIAAEEDLPAAWLGASLPGEIPSRDTLRLLTSRHNLPLQLSSFIGRNQEIFDLSRLLDSSRLVTVTGVGGSGKTRLALETARASMESFPDGVWFVELAPLSDPSLVTSLVAATLGLIQEQDRSVEDALVAYLRDRKAMLLLDNCEHLIDRVAGMVEVLLQHCPQLRILITSRERLVIDGEIVWSAPALSLPPSDDPLLANELIQYDAIRLFTERASAALPAFRLSENNAGLVTHLCRQLDGMPMAIELAAVKIRFLRVEQIVARLDNRFRLLVGGHRTAPPRHQSLQALIDWSYALLPPIERQLLRRLAVFANGFTLEAVEAVGDEENEGGTLESLTQLVNKSLVVADRALGREARYGLHETIRQYGLERLVEENAVEQMRDRHAAFYCRLAEEAEPQLYKAAQIHWLDQLEEKYDNLRAALNWTLVEHTSNAETGLRLAAALAYYWEMRGILVEGHRWLTAALENVNSVAIPQRAWFYLNAGNFWLEHGYFWGVSAMTYARESLSLYQRLEDEKGIAWTLRLLGNCTLYSEGEVEQAASLFEQGLALAEELNDKALMTRIYQNLGRAKMFGGDNAAAAKLGEKGLTLAHETGDRNAVGYLSFHLGVTAIMQREYARAEAFLLEALAVCHDLKLPVNATKTLHALGSAARLHKKYDQAASYFQEYLAIGRGIAGFDTFASPLGELGHITARQGDSQRAVGFLRESIETARGNRGDIIWALWGFGVVAAGLGRFRQAARLYAAVEQLLETTSWEVISPPGMEDYLGDIALVREQLSDADFAAAWAEGRAMSLEEAIAYALAATGSLTTGHTWA